ncbi:MAG TPA: D-Ala-D-Ala carboxypeptidase family metallohydrolase, partial [Chlamydiales bacterium]|nr:D-Ala-D-Ala carboxypeptidase family metallohydrolase [Chlamydiales bacterium]
MRKLLLAIAYIFSACSSSEEERAHSCPGEYIYRLTSDTPLEINPYISKPKPLYPWQSDTSASNGLKSITKEYFRCKGFSLNPPKVIKSPEGKETARYTDCGGCQKHSLSVRNKKEYIFPILLELVNHIQTVTKKQVIITSGHRCPDHNSYIDPSPQNSGSKHLIGAACDFYIKGLEAHPEVAVKIIQEFYRNDARYQKQKEYQEFRRFEKATNVATHPWLNKEVFIKL